MTELSPRLRRVVDALPLTPTMRVLEIGGGPGAAARAVAERLSEGRSILMIDRSAKAIAQARRSSESWIQRGVLELRQVAVEDFVLLDDDEPFDLAFAVRVGALDGRHPRTEAAAMERLALALRPEGRLYVDAGDVVEEVAVPRQLRRRI